MAFFPLRLIYWGPAFWKALIGKEKEFEKKKRESRIKDLPNAHSIKKKEIKLWHKILIIPGRTETCTIKEMPAEREHGYNDCRHLGKGEGTLDCTGSISILLVCRRPQGRQQCAWKGGLGQQVLRLSGEEGQTYSAGNAMSQKAFKQFTAIN